MARRKRFYDYRGFSGVDANIRISLQEYGIAWKQTKKDEYLFIIGVGMAEDEYRESYFNKFDYFYINARDYDSLIAESWIDLQSVADTMRDGDIDSLKSFDPYNVETLVSYHGYENIFGASYGSFEII